MTDSIIHHFFPHHSNNFRAKTLHHDFLLFYILILLFVQTFYVFVKKINGEILGYAKDITAEKILTLVNQERQKQGMDPLALSSQLSQAASAKASDMFAKDYWAHISPTGTTPWQFIIDSGYQYLYAGENLAKNFDTSDEVVVAWMNSPTHRANLLKSQYSEIGIAVLNGRLNGEDTTLVVQEFGSRGKPVIIAKSEKPAVIPEIKTEVAQAQPTQVEPIVVQVEEVMTEKVSKPPFRINRTISLLIAEFLLVILFIDSVFIWRHRTDRISGHSLAHIMFLLALFGAISFTGIGAIL